MSRAVVESCRAAAGNGGGVALSLFALTGGKAMPGQTSVKERAMLQHEGEEMQRGGGMVVLDVTRGTAGLSFARGGGRGMMAAEEKYRDGQERQLYCVNGDRREHADMVAASPTMSLVDNVAGALAAPIVTAARQQRAGSTSVQPRLTKRKQREQQFGGFSREATQIPRWLPCTRAINNSDTLRSIFVVDEDAKRRARFSWYSPHDGMVPSGWLTNGLLADIRFYYSSPAAPKASSSAQ